MVAVVKVSTALMMARAMARTLAGRMIFRPMHPEWSFKDEMLVRYVKSDIHKMTRLPLPEQRQYREERIPPNPLRDRIDVESVEIGDVPARWFIPKDSSSGALLYLHGGGYVFGSHRTHRDIITRLAVDSRMRVLAVNYRLAPEHPFPAGLEDARAAYRWLLENGYPATQVAIAGDSAGGGLTFATLLATRDAGEPLPACAIGISPWVDLTFDHGTEENIPYDYAVAGGEGWGPAYAGNTDVRDPLISPLYADLSGLPPLLVQAGGLEVLRGQIEEIAKRAEDAGTPVSLEVWPRMVHVWHMFSAALPEARDAITSIAKFMREHIPEAEA